MPEVVDGINRVISLVRKAISTVNSKHQYTHECLVKAKNSISRLINKGSLFTYPGSELTREGPLPRTNNRIEGGVNA